jgi:hypothetical protein
LWKICSKGETTPISLSFIYHAQILPTLFFDSNSIGSNAPILERDLFLGNCQALLRVSKDTYFLEKLCITWWVTWWVTWCTLPTFAKGI